MARRLHCCGRSTCASVGGSDRFYRRGFTLVELVVTLVLIGILAAVVAPRFANRLGFETRGFHDQVIAALQHARKQAVAQRRPVCVAVDAGGLALTRALAPGGACTAPLPDPATGAAYAVAAPGGVAIAGCGTTALPAAVVFDALGRTGSAVRLRITGSENRDLAVEPETGYVFAAACP